MSDCPYSMAYLLTRRPVIGQPKLGHSHDVTVVLHNQPRETQPVKATLLNNLRINNL